MSRIALMTTALAISSLCPAETLTPAWVELGDASRVIARVIIDGGACPAIQIDGTARPMDPRSPVPAGFRPLCESTIPATASKAAVNGQALVLPVRDFKNALVLGDTGCRIQGNRIQACNDPVAWPFKKVAALAAAENPQLIVHVGDYLYREEECPKEAQDKCAGSKSGDNWETWREDFFTPAAELLRAAPWAFVRGNHESCARSWRGWFYYLDPGPWTGACTEVSAAYTIQSINPPITMFDTSTASDNNMSTDAVKKLSDALSRVADRKGWIAAHHPFWAVRLDNASNKPDNGNKGLQQVWSDAKPKGFDLILSGHTHLFELLTFDTLPVQVVAGMGGTQLANPLPRSLGGVSVGSSMVMSGDSRTDFGYLVLSKNTTGWDLSLKSAASQTTLRCSIRGHDAQCSSTGQR